MNPLLRRVVIYTVSLMALSLDAQAQNPLSGLTDRFKVLTTGAKPTAQEQQEQRVSDNETLDPATDRLCDSLEKSYTTTESFLGVGAKAMVCKLAGSLCDSTKAFPTNSDEWKPWLREYSHSHVWLPVPLEQLLGKELLKRGLSDGSVMARSTEKTAGQDEVAADGIDDLNAMSSEDSDKLYTKVDAALAAAKLSYPQLPYDLTIHINNEKHVGAQAMFGGYIFVTRPAAEKLDSDALQLVIGHELAHLAKRHLSKQYQEQLLDLADSVDLFKQIRQGKFLVDAELASKLLDRLDCSFAHYDQDQESQADSCAARVMVGNKVDPMSAWKNYVKARGPDLQANADPSTAAAAAGGEKRNMICLSTPDIHLPDTQREQLLLTATAHHQGKTTAAAKVTATP